MIKPTINAIGSDFQPVLLVEVSNTNAAEFLGSVLPSSVMLIVKKAIRQKYRLILLNIGRYFPPRILTRVKSAMQN